MRVYKFKRLADFDRVAEIFYYSRFYNALFGELNDPMEGEIYNCDDDIREDYIHDMQEDRNTIRICCFSKTCRNQLLWAHYAEGFRGICIEVELIDWPEHEIAEVFYCPPSTWLHLSNDSGDYVGSWAKEVLKGKYSCWRYEKEVRVLTAKKYIGDPMCVIKSVLLGTRISSVMENAIVQLAPKGVTVFRTKISPYSNRVVKEKRLK